MKYLLTMFFCFSIFSVQAQTVDEAIKWNDDIVASQIMMLSLEDELISAISDNGAIDTIAITYVEYLTFLNEAINYYEGLPKFDRKDIFRIAYLDLLYAFRDVATIEYAEILKIWFKPADDLTEEDFSRWDELIEIIDSKEIKSNKAFLEKQIEFAKQYKFSLNE